jgi:translation initiation factor 3 subunit L
MCGRREDSLVTFEELFNFGSPRFILPFPSATGQNLTSHITSMFMTEIRQHVYTPILRSYLKLYSTLPLKKLATLLETKENVDGVKRLIVCYKHKTLQKRWVDGVVMNGEFGVAGDLDFYVDKRYS